MISMFLILYLIFLLIDFRPIYKKHNVLLSFLYLAFLLLSYIIIVLIALGIEVPNPTNLIERIITSIIPINY